jgi:choline dehydrogenase-like flavoprotein
MPTTATPQTTDFSRDVLGRYICNGLDEALRSTDTSQRPDARPFNVIVIGGGSFGSVLAQRIFTLDKTHSHRILVLEGGPFLLPEHVQNLPMMGINAAGATSIADLRSIGQDKQARNEVWGLAWHGNQKFPGLAYTVGGRSLFWGGWSPEPLGSELPANRWPNAVVAELQGSSGYYKEASEYLGVVETNDFIHGELHESLRQQLKAAVDGGSIPGAVPLAALPDHSAVRFGAAKTTAGVLERLGVPATNAAVALAGISGISSGNLLSDLAALGPVVVAGSPVAGTELLNLLKLEAPLAVETRTRSGYFPWNKFSSVPPVTFAARAAYNESAGDDVKRRLMVVPLCHVTQLATSNGRVTTVHTNLGSIPVPQHGVVVISLGTIESARLALDSFRTPHPGVPPGDFQAWRAMIGRNLMGHLRSNLTIRFPRTALTHNPAITQLQASALFLKCKHRHADNTDGHFHFQITAAGLGPRDADSEAELFKKVPDIDTFNRLLSASDSHVVVTIRGIGEMEPDNPVSGVFLDSELDEFQVPRANVTLVASAKDLALWDVMDQAAVKVAAALSNGTHEVVGKNRDGLGTTHHEAGTLSLGTVTEASGRLKHVDNAYAAGPALFPTVGSPNPMLTGVALARRLARHLVPAPAPFTPEAGFTSLFDGMAARDWRMLGDGGFRIVDGTLETTAAGSDIGLYWHEKPMPNDFVLRLQWLRWNDHDNSGVFVRFPDPLGKGYNNPAYVGVHFGFEVQIDELAPNIFQSTGAIYDEPGQIRTPVAARAIGQWNDFEIRVQGQNYAVFLNGTQVTAFANTHAGRGSTGQPTFIGLQSYPGKRVAFRNLRFK